MKNNKVTVIPGDGIGAEITSSVIQIIDSLKLNIEWEYVDAGKIALEKQGVLVPSNVYKSIEKNKVAIKGPIETPIGKGFKSINVELRKKYDLYKSIRPVKSLIPTRFDAIDLVIFRENTEGLYIGIEEYIDDDTIHAIKKVTTLGCTRIINAAFEFAKLNSRKKVTLVHKANILKLADGHFLNIGINISKNYPDIIFESVIVDNMCMQLVLNPNQFDVIVSQNLYGDIMSDLCAGLVGGLGIVPGANIGDDIAIFEAVHGTAPDIANKNIANPTALLLSGCMMLEYLGLNDASFKIKKCLQYMIDHRQITGDLGGKLSTTEFTDTFINQMDDLEVLC